MILNFTNRTRYISTHPSPARTAVAMSPSGIPHTSIHGVMSRYRTGRVRSLAPIRNQRRGSKQPRRWCRNVGNIPHSCHTTGRTHAPSFDCLRRWCVTGQAVHWFSLCHHPSPSRAARAMAQALLRPAVGLFIRLAMPSSAD